MLFLMSILSTRVLDRNFLSLETGRMLVLETDMYYIIVELLLSEKGIITLLYK